MRVLAFRHSPSDGLGLIGDALDVYAISYDYADLYAPLSAAPLVSEADALILMGGSMSANDALPFIPREIEYIKGAVWTLYRIPMDLIEWTVRNSRRRDVPVDAAPDRFGQRQSTTLLPPDERPVMKWNSNPFQFDGGNGGRMEDDGAFFLLPYWMERYLGLLLE